MTDGPPTRHLHPIGSEEPPFDPRYDAPPDTRRPPADRAAELATLATLIYSPNGHELVDHELDAADFYWPAHAHLWDAWHDLHAADGVPPDAITLNAALVAKKDTESIRLLASLAGSDPAHALNAAKHAKLIRDAARLRVVQELGTGFIQLASTGNADLIEPHLGEALQRLDETVMRFGATPTTTASGYKDLAWVLTGQAPEIEPPRWVHHDAGHALFYAGKVNGVFGDPETAKTWLAQCAIVEALNTGGTAAMVDVDHNGENHTAARLLLLGARPDAIADGTRFRYYDPEDGEQLRTAITEIHAMAPDVFLLDSLGEVFPMLGLSSNDGDELTGGLRTISRPADAGTCVIFIDHLPKGTEARATGFAIGSIAKKRAVRGSYIRAEERVKPAPGQLGKISLFIEKDTAGELRRQTPGGKYLGTFVIDSREPHVTRWSIAREDAPTAADGTKRYTRVMERISRHIEDNDQCTGRDLRDAIGGRPEIVTDALKTLIAEGFVSVMKGSRNAHLHHSIAHYREAEDDHLNPTD